MTLETSPFSEPTQTLKSREVMNNDKLNLKEKFYILICHFSLWMLLPVVIPVAVLFLTKNHVIIRNSKEVLNFQLSCLTFLLIAYIFCITPITMLLISTPMIVSDVVYLGIFSLIGSVKSFYLNEYRYPFSIKFLKIKTSIANPHT